jgi:heme-degrading monooxygenase HmoA
VAGAPRSVLVGESGAVIIRVFRGQVQPGKQDAFLRTLREQGIPHFRSHPGMLGVHVGFPTEQAPDEFLVTTMWEDLDAVRTFAGERWYEPKILPGERQLLKRVFVHHYWTEEGERWPPREPPEVVDLGRLRVDLRRRVVRLDGREIDVPPREFTVLAELATRPGHPVPAEELARRVWPDRAEMNGDDVRRVVYRLRRLLDDGRRRSLIRNRRGHGYVLEPGR